jgi:hypothetical protein
VGPQPTASGCKRRKGTSHVIELYVGLGSFATAAYAAGVVSGPQRSKSGLTVTVKRDIRSRTSRVKSLRADAGSPADTDG